MSDTKNKLSLTLKRMFDLHPKLIDFDLKRLKFLMDKFFLVFFNLNKLISHINLNKKSETLTILKF